MMPKEIAVLNFINANKLVYTEQIASALSFSESTVRRILDKLNQNRKIVRFHGGATAMTELEAQSALLSRYEVNIDTKERLAQAAADMITSSSSVILLGGTTVASMCKYLTYKTLTVITNSTLVLDQLKFIKNIRLILLGGEYDADEAEMRGSLTVSSLQHVSADFLFSSCTAFDDRRGFLTSKMSSIEFYRQCYRAAKKVCMVADSSKLGQREIAVIARCDDVDCLVTDSALPAESGERFRAQGVTVRIA